MIGLILCCLLLTNLDTRSANASAQTDPIEVYVRKATTSELLRFGNAINFTVTIVSHADEHRNISVLIRAYPMEASESTSYANITRYPKQGDPYFSLSGMSSVIFNHTVKADWGGRWQIEANVTSVGTTEPPISRTFDFQIQEKLAGEMDDQNKLIQQTNLIAKNVSEDAKDSAMAASLAANKTADYTFLGVAATPLAAAGSVYLASHLAAWRRRKDTNERMVDIRSMFISELEDYLKNLEEILSSSQSASIAVGIEEELGRRLFRLSKIEISRYIRTNPSVVAQAFAKSEAIQQVDKAYRSIGVFFDTYPFERSQREANSKAENPQRIMPRTTVQSLKTDIQKAKDAITNVPQLQANRGWKGKLSSWLHVSK